eukprot:1160837-Pelagomonas_calceolata.AAC.5
MALHHLNPTTVPRKSDAPISKERHTLWDLNWKSWASIHLPGPIVSGAQQWPMFDPQSIGKPMPVCSLTGSVASRVVLRWGKRVEACDVLTSLLH